MRIDVIFDTICPWCFIGKRRLERALKRRPAIQADMRWRPFLLNPDIQEDGLPRGTYLERKFGGPARVSRILANLREAGAAEGIAFDFDAIQRTPNTLDAHRLVRLAADQGRASVVVDALFHAYFIDGHDTSDHLVLRDLADACGMNGDEVSDILASPQGRGEVYMENAHTHRMSINGVPCFIFDGAYGIAGAQDPDILIRMIDMAAEGGLEEPLSSPRAPLPTATTGQSNTR